MNKLYSLALVGLSALCLRAQDPIRTLRVQQAAVQPVAQEARVALVIGNGAYKDSPLKNPLHDARTMASAFQGCGFSVTKLENATRSQMREAIRAFGAKIAEGGVGLFYYAGHGMQVKGRNYLIPVGADIAQEDEVEGEAVEVDAILAKMETARNRLNILILDACRNNPFGRSFRSSQQGLAQMDAPTGTYVAFATSPGKTAADGAGDNGMYTQALLHQLKVPGLRLEEVFKLARAEVLKASDQKQTPWENSSIVGDFYFLPAVAPPTAVTVAAMPMLPSAPVAMAELGALQVTVNAPGSQVYVDGVLKGTASPTSALNVTDIPVGEVQIRVESPGYGPVQQRVTIEMGKWTQSRLVLQKLLANGQVAPLAVPPPAAPWTHLAPPPPVAPIMVGHLQVLVNAPGAKVFVEGELKGEAGPLTPVNVENLPVGDVSVKVEATGYESRTDTFKVAEGNWTQAKVVLSRKAEKPPEPPLVAPAGTQTNAMGRPERSVDLGYGQRITLVPIPAGSLTSGAESTGVNNIQDFWIGRDCVTQGQWKAVMGKVPSCSVEGLDLPVDHVSWGDCQKFVWELNNKNAGTFRLPTVREFEYAYQGTHDANSFGLLRMQDDESQWCQAIDSNGKPIDDFGIFNRGTWKTLAPYVRYAEVTPSGPNIYVLRFRVVAVALPK